jgi:tetratricopeptide (TPR) repeat protein
MAKEDNDYFESEDFKEILSEYETSVNSGSPVYMDADDLVDIADYYNMHGEMDKCHQALECATELHPESIAPTIFKAREAMFRGDYELAKKYEGQIENNNDLDYYYLHAELLIRDGKEDEAESYLDNCLSETNEEYQDFVLDVVNIFNDYKLYHKSYDWISRLKDTESIEFKELMGEILFNLGKYKDSNRIFNELIEEDPFSSDYWNSLSNSQFMQDDYKEALTSSEYAIAINPNDTEAILNKANSLFHLNNIEEALIFFRRFTQLVPNDETGYFLQGVSLNNLDRYQEAVICLKRADELSGGTSSSQLQIYQELAFSLSSLGKVDESLSYIDKTEKLECDHSEMMVVRGHILLSNKKESEAFGIFEKALEMSSNIPATALRISVSLFDNKYYEKAYDMFQHLFNNASKDWKDGYSYMALCCKDLKKVKEFLTYLKKACEINPTEAKEILGEMFPDEMEPNEYYNYVFNKIKDYLK